MTSLKRPRRSWAEDDTGEPAPPATVRISYRNLPPESRKRLDGAVREWMSWHVDKYPQMQGYRPPEVVSGELSYEPGLLQLGQGTCPAFEDKPAPPEKAPSGTVWFNIAYEKVGDVPQYDRTVDAGLTYTNPKKQRANGRWRPAAQQLALAPADGAGGDGAGATNGGGGGAAGTPAGRPAKRPRGGAAQRCFNCGSYAHSMRDCWQPYNKELVEQMKREFEEAREGGAAFRSSAKRYFLPGAAGGGVAATLEAEFEGLRAGQLTEGLRAALGIGPLDPPPWLQRMRALGLPPAYYIVASKQRGEGEEGEENGAAAGAEAASAADNGASAAAALGNGAAADAFDGVAEELLTSSREAQPVPEDFIPIPGTPGASSGSEDEGGPGGGPGNGWEGVVVYAAQFPGLNAPVPEGADHTKWDPPQQQQPMGGSRRGADGGGRPYSMGAGGGGFPPPPQEHHPRWQDPGHLHQQPQHVYAPAPPQQQHPPPMVSAHHHLPPQPTGFYAPYQHHGW